MCKNNDVTEKRISKMPSSNSIYEKQKLHLVEPIISFGEYHQYDWKISLKTGKKQRYIE